MRFPLGLILLSGVISPAQATSTDNSGSAGLGFAIIALVLLFYFIPSIIGFNRGVVNSGTLCVVNFLTGWTGLGWLGCILWAVCGSTQNQDHYYRRQATQPLTKQQADEQEEFRRWKEAQLAQTGKRREPFM